MLESIKKWYYTIQQGSIALGPARLNTILWQDFQTSLGALDTRRLGLGGWTPSVHHTYDPLGRVLYQGNGTRRSADNSNLVMTTVAGNGQLCAGMGNGIPATQSPLGCGPYSLAFAPDGSYYITLYTGSNMAVGHVDANGIISTLNDLSSKWDYINEIVVSRDGKYLYLAPGAWINSYTGIYRYNLTNGELKRIAGGGSTQRN